MVSRLFLHININFKFLEISMANVGDRLKEIRIYRKMLQRDIAQDNCIVLRTYQSYETGLSNPTAPILVKLAEYFNLSADYLLGLIDQPVPLSAVQNNASIHNGDSNEKIIASPLADPLTCKLATLTSKDRKAIETIVDSLSSKK
jgi:transcriptional regulator with XRE-family HTH domain